MNRVYDLCKNFFRKVKTGNTAIIYIIFIIGTVIMLLGTTANTRRENKYENNISCEQRIEQMLSKINGVEEAEVMITYQTSYSKDAKSVWYSENEKEKNESALGVIVVCKGADNLQTKQKIIDAVCAATGVYEHNVGVFEKN